MDISKFNHRSISSRLIDFLRRLTAEMAFPCSSSSSATYSATSLLDLLVAHGYLVSSRGGKSSVSYRVR
eukprot:scaffold18125_cov161-Skeletonema_marinoi.AAC.2